MPCISYCVAYFQPPDSASHNIVLWNVLQLLRRLVPQSLVQMFMENWNLRVEFTECRFSCCKSIFVHWYRHLLYFNRLYEYSSSIASSSDREIWTSPYQCCFCCYSSSSRSGLNPSELKFHHHSWLKYQKNKLVEMTVNGYHIWPLFYWLMATNLWLIQIYQSVDLLFVAFETSAGGCSYKEWRPKNWYIQVWWCGWPEC